MWLTRRTTHSAVSSATKSQSAIVVGVSTLALGLAIVVRIFEAYGTIEEDEILDAD